MNKTFTAIIKDSARCSLWVLIFLALVQPFGIDNMKEDRMAFILAETGLAFISIVISSVIGNAITRKWANDGTTLGYIKSLIVCNIINIPLLGAMLLTLNSWYFGGGVSEYWFSDGHFTLYPLAVMSMYVSIISLFIVAAQYMKYRNDTLRRELEEVKAINLMLEERQERLEEEELASDEAQGGIPAEERQIDIVGQGQGATLTLNPRNIIYVESMANYADICYIADNETKHSTLRITLKQIRETLEEVESIVQCHRAFLVNVNFVVAMTNRNPGYQLQLFGMDKQIPVSRANTEAIKSKLS